MKPRAALGLFTVLVLAGGPSSLGADPPSKYIHVIVALCDNEHQGIVPVPAKIGDGDDPANNLYWGALYGVKTHFKKSAQWENVSCGPGPKPEVLERCVFRHASGKAVMVADAYRGREIGKATIDFLALAAGHDGPWAAAEKAGRVAAGMEAEPSLIAYAGHDGLMDFTLPEYPRAADEGRRDVIILACMSKRFFQEAIRASGAYPVVWTTGLMAPEAYTLEAALEGYVRGEDPEKIRRRAAAAYDRYQRCGEKAALALFATGF